MDTMHAKVAVVTGGASGIGLAMARRFAGAGANVVLADIERAALDRACTELADRFGVEALGVTCDVSRAEAVEALAAQAYERFGTVHVVCNNAGVGGGGPVAEVSQKTWEWVLGVNLWGVIHGCRVFLPRLLAQGEGHIVNTASVAGLTSHPNMAPYNVSKFGVVTLSETLWQELHEARSPVGVSVLCPGFVNTKIIESDRNRPEHLVDLGVVATEEQEAMRTMVRELYDRQLDPDVVGGLVLDAVLAKRFYIFTDDQFRDAIRTRHAAIEEGRDPTPTGQLWEALVRQVG